MSKPDFEMTFDPGTIKHLGLQMYSTLPPVIGELVSNAWDADATRVDVTLPTTLLNDLSELIVSDNGLGMSDEMVRAAYLIVGRDRRKDLSGNSLDEAALRSDERAREGLRKNHGP